MQREQRVRIVLRFLRLCHELSDRLRVFGRDGRVLIGVHTREHIS
ncbi:hypothetical protein [Streptomonospora salina]|uniref:Uncharacterized protein n=1 Tax=Streptomonospora salina TaxID=104205 RepID=A0A841EBW4_9ACTN|nr:hypothetical protein [Streptomonospora salina]MBB5998819.1 hypothetical protein [Streptomonospora salina]